MQAARTASVVVIPSRWEEPGATIAVEMFMADAAVIASAIGAPGEIFHGHGRLFRRKFGCSSEVDGRVLDDMDE